MGEDVKQTYLPVFWNTSWFKMRPPHTTGATIDKAHPLLQLTVYEKDLHHIQVGNTLAFRANGMGKKNFHATVVSIDQAVDDKDYSIKVYAKVTTDDQAFRPGMYVRARVSTPVTPTPAK